ncbi:hypothetical protein BIW11_10369 [Tropilaelaps mercedesae]|uniref:Uncharacterized protein n=1 Tax=Tropilaelaps mercedesae TaxID=418985 RepID=A0A1V9XG21_9ACAR|nr:hypothetical protein BIW11_10369 [Tropilaelaps mercedesae]
MQSTLSVACLTLLLARSMNSSILLPMASAPTTECPSFGGHSVVEAEEHSASSLNPDSGTTDGSGDAADINAATMASPASSVSDISSIGIARDEASTTTSLALQDDLIGQSAVTVAQMGTSSTSATNVSTRIATDNRRGDSQDGGERRKSMNTEESVVALANSTEPHCKSNEKVIEDILHGLKDKGNARNFTLSDRRFPCPTHNNPLLHLQATNCHVLCSKGVLFYYSAGRKADQSECVVNTYYVGSKQTPSLMALATSRAEEAIVDSNHHESAFSEASVETTELPQNAMNTTGAVRRATRGLDLLARRSKPLAQILLHARQ